MDLRIEIHESDDAISDEAARESFVKRDLGHVTRDHFTPL
jgi:hypothetical protein